MSANIFESDTNFYIGDIPWHGLGNDCTVQVKALGRDLATGAEAYAWSGLEAARTSLNPVVQVLADGSAIEIPRRFAHSTIATGRFHGLVSNRYPDDVQPDILFNLPDSIVESGQGGYETAGSLGGGLKVYACARINQSRVIRRGGVEDLLNDFYVTTYCNGGNGALEGFRTSIRVVCDNTLSMARSRSVGDSIRLKHAKDCREQFELAESEMFGVIAGFGDQTEQFQLMADTPISLADWRPIAREFADRVAGSAPSAQKTTAKVERMTGIRNAEVESLEYLFQHGRGNTGETLWDCLNAGSEWLDHHREPYRQAKNLRERESKQVDSTLFGDNRAHKDLLVEMLSNRSVPLAS